MNLNQKPIIVNTTIDNPPKQIVLNKERGINIYWVMMDKVCEAQVSKNINGWAVNPVIGGRLKGQNCDEILQAVLNAENPNS